MAFQFITLDEALALHAELLARYGGEPGILKPNELDSALHAPQASFAGEFLYADIYEMAAAYAFLLIANHPFVDGNKRTGYAVALVFLRLNGRTFPAERRTELEALVLAAAAGDHNRGQLASLLRDACGGV